MLVTVLHFCSGQPPQNLSGVDSLKDFRRVATRYDRNATNFLAAVCIAATVSYWL
jgi:transposase